MPLPTNAVRPSPSQIVRAVVVSNATSYSAPLHVKIPSYGNSVSEVSAWVPIQPLPQAGDVCIVAYDETGVPTVIAWERINVPQRALVATLPTAPADGEEVYFQNAAMATAGDVWHLRYRAESSSAYKWEFVGGGGLAARIDTQESTTSVAWVDLATVGPAVVAPLAGDYEVAFGCWMLNNGAGGAGKWVQAALNLGAGIDETASAIATYSTGNTWYSGAKIVRRSVAAAATVKMQYTTQAGQATFENRELVLRPVRVG